MSINKKIDQNVCKHSYTRIWAGTYYNFDASGNPVLMLWFGCMDCGKFLGEKPFYRKDANKKLCAVP